MSLNIGNVELKVPIIMSPMAGWTNLPYRLLCGADKLKTLFVNEMVATPKIAYSNLNVKNIVNTSNNEIYKSIQLYVLDEKSTEIAITKILKNKLADHIDLNFACPVRKVTRIGGGCAMPLNKKLYKNIIKTAVRTACGIVPVTVKLRLGISNDQLTYLKASEVAVEKGISAIFLHCRTAKQYYSGNADWSHINILKKHINSQIPIIANGDITNYGTYKITKELGADGASIGRACLGRPWVFKQIYNREINKNYDYKITLNDIIKYIKKHSELALKYSIGKNGIDQTTKIFETLRKYYIYYFKGINIGSTFRKKLVEIKNLKEQNEVLDVILQKIDGKTIINEQLRRGKTSKAKHIYLSSNFIG